MADGSYRVARVITRLNIGGPSIQAIDLSQTLAADGFETCLIHGRLADGEGDMTKLLPLGDMRAVHLPDLVRPISPWNDLKALVRLVRLLREWRPDIVHTHMAKAGSLGRLAAVVYNWTRPRAARARLIHTYHGHVFEGYFGSPTTKVFLAVERWLARRTDALVAISPQVRTDLLETYHVARASQLHLVPLGFNLDRFLAVGDAARAAARRQLDIPEDAIAVSTVGRLTGIKQHGLFLEMAARLQARGGHYVFLIVGDGELRQTLEAQAAELGIASHVRFLGWRGDLDVIYGATDVFVLTSRNEGTPVALIEAMASGTAAVSTHVGGVGDVVTGPELGVLVPFGDADALADGVASFAADPGRRAAVGEAGRASVRDRYHAARLRNDIRQLYWQLLANGGTISTGRRP